MSLAERDAKSTDPNSSKSEIPISKGWVQGVALVLIFGFFVMCILAVRTYSDSMPLPNQLVGTDGGVDFTDEDITEGQRIFLSRGLQQYGPIIGHGGYLGPDYTAEYLRLSSDHVRVTLESQGILVTLAATVEIMLVKRYDSYI